MRNSNNVYFAECAVRKKDVDVDVERMYELRQSPLCPPQTYDLHSNDTIKSESIIKNFYVTTAIFIHSS